MLYFGTTAGAIVYIDAKQDIAMAAAEFRLTWKCVSTVPRNQKFMENYSRNPVAFDVSLNTRELTLHVFRQVQAVTREECARICDKNGDATSAAEIRDLPMQEDLRSER
jgi:hypothetical protein